MIKIIINKKYQKEDPKIKNFSFSNGKLFFDKNDKILKFSKSKNEEYIIYGKINYIFYSNSTTFKNYSEKLLKKIINRYPFSDLSKFIDGKFLIVKIVNKKIKSIIPDKFSKIDFFYSNQKNSFHMSDTIQNFRNYKNNFDNFSLANLFMNYGSYVPKPKTIYKNIRRLNINEFITINKNMVKIEKKKINSIKTSKEFNLNKDLYHSKFKTLFLNAIKKRSSQRMNWVYISSGFDSTSILASLNRIVGNKKITAIIAELKYSQKYGVCNKFEIDRAQKICNYFGIPLKKIKLDYSKKSIISQMKEVRKKFRFKHVFSITTNNFYQMAKYIEKNGKTNDCVFNGDLSDGLQNLGFSQFATILDHPSISFREYADKMFSYLYGPTFYSKIIKKKHFNDKIFNFLLKEKNINLNKNIIQKSKNEYLFKYLSPIFLSPSRFPFTEIINNKLINKTFKKKYSQHMYKNYFHNIINNLKSENLYSSIIYLYNIFHWNSGTVQCCLKSPEILNIKSSTPFWDSNLQKYFSEMPENWGRGLDMNNTKYALKYFLKNKIDYPMDLQKGPHSYIYDVDSRWSADLDILYHSYLRNEFVNCLKESNLNKILNSSIFNIKYIKSIIKKYYQKKYVYGSDLLTLKNLIIFTFFVLEKK